MRSDIAPTRDGSRGAEFPHPSARSDEHQPELDGVALIHWPDQQGLRAELMHRRRPRLLLIAAGAVPPTDSDELEDWTRAEAASDEARVRIAALRRRGFANTPLVEELELTSTHLSRGTRRVPLTTTQRAVLAPLVHTPGAVIARAALLGALAGAGSPANAAVLRSTLARLDRAIAPLGLRVTALTRHAVVLEVGPAPGS